MIYVSTGGQFEESAHDYALKLSQEGIQNIELSGGLAETFDIEKYLLLSRHCHLQLHNYFPPPLTPLVFNLASKNQEIASASIQMVKNAISISHQLNHTVYSFHAGFLIDPATTELGKNIQKQKINDRQEALQLFIDRVSELAGFAETKNVELLIENNVLTKNNYETFGQDPLLMTSSEESCLIMESTPDNVNMLFDVAHWKVSANTLNFEIESMAKTCEKWIKAYHLSDNDGLNDTNNPIREDSWFWPCIQPDRLFYTIEVYNVTANIYLSQIELLKNKIRAAGTKRDYARTH